MVPSSRKHLPPAGIASPSPGVKPVRRPWLLAGVFAVLGTAGVTRAVLVVQNGDFYQSIGLAVPLAVLALYGIAWGLAGYGGMAALFVRRPSARWWVWGCAGMLTLTYWIDRLVLTVDPERAGNTAFVLVLNLLLLGWTAFVLHRKKARRYFRIPLEETLPYAE
jgi:hypothetical protein